MKLCEAPIDVLRSAIRSYQADQHPPTGKMDADALLAYTRKYKKARLMIPKTYRDNRETDIPLSIVRKTILDYRRKHHPAASRMRRAELEAYMRRVKIKPVGKELPKLKRNQCQKPGDVDEQAVIDAATTGPASQRIDAPIKGPKKKKKRGRPRKSTLLNTDAGARAVQDMLPDLEARAAAMDEDDSLAW
jgi:hypothetical protein